VRHIATYNPVSCDVDDLVAEVWSRSEHVSFDAMPVKDGDRVVGLLEKIPVELQGTAGERMRTLDDSILVSADLPLGIFIHMAGERSARLVVTDTGINAIVTQSDLSKLPVRIFIFTLITHLESLMAELISKRGIDEAVWLSSLSAKRQANVRRKFNDLQVKRLDLSLLECTDFCDKRDVVRKLCGWTRKFEKDFIQVETLRNSVAHAGDYLDTENGLTTMPKTIEKAEFWIDEITRQIKGI
jgi:hypothetical protein